MSSAHAAREPTHTIRRSSDDDDPDSYDDHPDYRAATTDDKNEAADVSVLRTKDDVDAVCKKHGVPRSQYTGLPAGDLRASSSPPPGAVCVYAHALQAGMRVPLHPFFCEALTHFRIAPTQLAPNGWRIMAGFVVLCHYAGVPPSLAVFRHFFLLAVLNQKDKCWYRFRSKDCSGLRFAGLPECIKGWKSSFFFLSSPTPWPCPVEWGEPSKSSLLAPVLTGEEKRSVAILLRVNAGAPVDIRTYLRDSSLAAAMISQASPAPTPPPLLLPPPFISTTAGSKGMDPCVYGMMKTILADKAAAAQTPAQANKVKSEPDSDAPSRGKKRSLDEADGEEEPLSSVLPNSSPAAHGSSVPAGMCSPPPGISRKPTRFPKGHDDDNTDWEAARELLRGIVAPPQDRAFAASRPSDVVASCYVAVLQAANYASFSLGYALELEEKLAARDAEIAVLREKLEKAQAALR